MSAQSIQETRPHRVSPYYQSRSDAKTAPQKPEMWLNRALKASSLPEKLACLNRVHYLDPYHPLGRRLTYNMIWHLLEKEPYLEYKDENNTLYMVSNGNDIAFTVPKDRNVPETYPAKEADPINSAFRWLGWAILGLTPAGLGTLIFAPLAVLRVLQAFLMYPLDQADQTRAALILVVAGILLIIALILNFLLIVHFL
jgi:hypothetical protein